MGTTGVPNGYHGVPNEYQGSTQGLLGDYAHAHAHANANANDNLTSRNRLKGGGYCTWAFTWVQQKGFILSRRG